MLSTQTEQLRAAADCAGARIVPVSTALVSAVASHLQRRSAQLTAAGRRTTGLNRLGITLYKWMVFSLVDFDAVLFADIDVDVFPSGLLAEHVREAWKHALPLLMEQAASETTRLVASPDGYSLIHAGVLLALPPRDTRLFDEGVAVLHAPFNETHGWNVSGPPHQCFLAAAQATARGSTTASSTTTRTLTRPINTRPAVPTWDGSPPRSRMPAGLVGHLRSSRPGQAGPAGPSSNRRAQLPAASALDRRVQLELDAWRGWGFVGGDIDQGFLLHMLLCRHQLGKHLGGRRERAHVVAHQMGLRKPWHRALALPLSSLVGDATSREASSCPPELASAYHYVRRALQNETGGTPHGGGATSSTPCRDAFEQRLRELEAASVVERCASRSERVAAYQAVWFRPF